MGFKSEALAPGCIRVTTPFSSSTEVFPHLFQSDLHIDSEACDRYLLKQHWEQAKEINAPIFLLGDIFDAMQAKGDPRHDRSDLKALYKEEDYINQMLKDVAGFVAPYASNIAGIAYGNHETGFLKHQGFDLIQGLVDQLELLTGHRIPIMGYAGWIFLRMTLGDLENSTRAVPRLHCKVWFTHGSGGSTATGKGVQRAIRRSVNVPDANVVFSAHIHDAWMMEWERIRITDRGEQRQDTQLHIQLPSYCEGFDPTGRSWSTRGEHSVKPKGGWWLDLKIERRPNVVKGKDKRNRILRYTARRAV